jgi:HSP20 family protein
MTEKKDKGESGFGGLFRGIGNLIELIARLSEEGFQKKGELRFPEGGKAVYGLSIRTLKGEPVIETFGNLRESPAGPTVEEVREPIVDIFDEEDHVRIIVELPGVAEDEIELEVAGDILDLNAFGKDRKYAKEILLPSPVKAGSLTTSFKNGVLEITLAKEKT